MGWTRYTSDGLQNIHRRSFADPERAWALVRRVHEPDSGVWPSDSWPPLKLDWGLVVGSQGGHGPIHYHVSASEPERFRFDFDPGSLTGWHEFRREGAQIVHELRLFRPGLALRWTIIPLHDALLEDLLNNVEDRLADPVGLPRERHWSPWVRSLRALAQRRQSRTPRLG